MVLQGAEPQEGLEAYQEGIYLRGLGDLVGAERQLRKALDLDPGNAEYHFELANLYALRYDAAGSSHRDHLQTEVLDQAARELEQTVMIRPEFLAARYNLGVVYKRQRRFEEAREQFRRALEMDPRQVNAHLQIGATYEEQGFFEEARSVYRKARELDFSNSGIEGAMEDLKDREEKAEDKKWMEAGAGSFGYLNRGFRYTPHSHADQFNQERLDSLRSGGSLPQALPYLGAWLYEQFMKMRGQED